MENKSSKLFRFFIFLLIVLHLPQMANAAGKKPSGSGTSSSPYLIVEAENLRWFADQVNKEGGGGICAKLVNDINLDDLYSNELMIGTSDNPFWGEFDGDNHTISGVRLYDVIHWGPNSCLYEGGLFGCIKAPSGTTAVVKNLTVEGALTKAAYETTYYIGGVIGIAYGNVDVSNVISRVNITIGKNSKYAHCGGIVGSAEWFDPKKQDGKLNVRDCINYGTINVSCAENCGGIVGYIREGSITDCLNVGNITNSEDGTTGGILGYVNTTAFSMTRCLNVGTVSAEDAYSVYYAKKGTIGEASELLYKSGVGGKALEAIEVSESELKNGKVAFQLWNSNWGQSIGNNSVNDAYPIPNKRDYKVYHTDYTSDYYYNYITSTVPTGDFTTTIETAADYSKNGIRIGDTRSFTVTGNAGSGKYIKSVKHNGKTLYASKINDEWIYSYTVALNNEFEITTANIGCTTKLNQSTGTIDLSDNVPGDTETFTVTPKAGYYIKDATINGSTIAGTIVSSKTDGTKSFSFTVGQTNTVTINTEAIACTTTLNQTTSTLNVKDNILGSTETFTATPKAGYYIKNANLNGTTSTGKAVSGKTDGTKSFSFTVKESNTVTINTAAISCTTTLNQSTCTIDLADNIIGSTETFTVTPKAAWRIKDATINGETIAGTATSGKTDGSKTFSFTVKENNTVIINMTQHNFVDGVTHSAVADRENEYVYYERTFTHTDWQALFIPFSMSYDDWKGYGSVAELSMVSGSESDLTLTWKTLGEGSTIEAGKPYIFKPNSASYIVIELLSTTLKAASCARSVTVQAADGTIITLSGTFDGKSDMKTSGAYALQGGAFKKASSDDAVLKPQRIYLTISPGVSTKSVPASISCDVVNQ